MQSSTTTTKKKCPICDNETKNSICSECGFDLKFAEVYNQFDLNLLDSAKLKQIDELLSYPDIDEVTFTENLMKIGILESVGSTAMNKGENEVEVEIEVEKKGEDRFSSLFKKK